jgi:hypothetical protein
LISNRGLSDATSDTLCELLAVASGGVVFTTIHKFLPDMGEKMPKLSPRLNIIVIADEAHRSQYDLIDGLAWHMGDALPNASFIKLTPSRPRSVELRPALRATYLGRPACLPRLRGPLRGDHQTALRLDEREE